MRQINLTQGQVAIVDDQDFAELSIFRWCYRSERNGAQGYALRAVRVGRRYRLLYLHRAIMNAPKGFEVIFLNYDRLDCRRQNLKVATVEEARRHHRVRFDSRSRSKGIRFDPINNNWIAKVVRNRRSLYIGRFGTQDEATDAYEDYLRRENPGLFPELDDGEMADEDRTNA